MVRAPYPGHLKLGSTGEPVVLMKRALRAAGLLPGKGKPTGFLGPFAVRALRKLGKAHTLPALAKPGVVKHGTRGGLHVFDTTGAYGPRAHVKLANYYDDYGAQRLRAYARLRQVQSVAAAGLAAMNLIITMRGLIHYTQSARRMSGVRYRLMPPHFGTTEDCSSEVTWVAWVMDQVARRFGGRYPDPNGLDYNGQGYTGTIAGNGIPVQPAAGPPVFTAVLYGWFPFHHVVRKMTMEMAMSMGQEADPRMVSIFYRLPTAARVVLPVLPRV
jgi:hypothetical protein